MTDGLLYLHLHLQLHRRTLLWLNIESQRKIEEIVACHLQEEKINPSPDHDLDQETDLFCTIEKNQRRITEKGQDPHRIRERQNHDHRHTL